MYVCVCKCERVCVFVIGKLRIHWIVQNILPASSYFRNPYLFFCHQRVITRSATSCVCCCSRVLVQLLKKVVSCRQQEVKPNLKITKERKKNLSGARAGERRKKRWSLPEAMWHSNQPVGCWNPFFFFLAFTWLHAHTPTHSIGKVLVPISHRNPRIRFRHLLLVV